MTPRALRASLRIDLQEAREFEVEEAGDHVVREILGGIVVPQHGVIERLARERDLVLGSGQLFLELDHVLAGLEIRIGLGQGKKPAESGRQSALGRSQFLDRFGVGRVRLGRGEAGLCRVARLDDILERLALVLHVALDGFDEVRDQVVAPRELHIDLGECVLYPVSLVDQPVVNADPPEHNRDNDREENQE